MNKREANDSSDNGFFLPKIALSIRCSEREWTCVVAHCTPRAYKSNGNIQLCDELECVCACVCVHVNVKVYECRLHTTVCYGSDAAYSVRYLYNVRTIVWIWKLTQSLQLAFCRYDVRLRMSHYYYYFVNYSSSTCRVFVYYKIRFTRAEHKIPKCNS